jgi:uncharacterized protein YutE (UPF0331/DUF86 family)
VVAAKTELVLRMLAGIATLPLATESEFVALPHAVAAGESYLRRGLEALFDFGRHVLAKGHGISGTEYKEVARRLGENGVLEPREAALMFEMAGYRNRLVHFYDEVTAAELYRILTVHRDDIRVLLDALRAWIAARPQLLDETL